MAVAAPASADAQADQFAAEAEELLASALKQKLKASQSQWGNDFYVNNPHIAPLRGALAV